MLDFVLVIRLLDTFDCRLKYKFIFHLIFTKVQSKKIKLIRFYRMGVYDLGIVLLGSKPVMW